MELTHPDFPDDGPLAQAIKAACVAGGLREWARIEDDGGLARAADEWSAMASASLREAVEC